MKSLRTIIILFTLTMLSILVVACDRDGGEPVPPPEDTYPVDPIFRNYYDQLGGEDVLGPAISPVFEDDGAIYQYTVGSLMKYEAGAPEGEAYNLAPLGREMGIYELPASPSDEPDALYVDGHTIFEKFVPLYQQMGGKKVVGKPLTEAHKNILKNRYEQYFENVGFYWIEGDLPEAVYLLGYGSWKCDRYCRHAAPQNSLILIPSQSATPFVRTVAQQGLDFTGFALTLPYISEEGHLEQIYENLVMTVHPNQPETVSLLPIALWLEITPDELAPAIPAAEMHFFQVQEGLGYNIPTFYMEYIEAHGGFEFLGYPITQVSIQADHTYQQCLSNLCLEGVPDGAGSVLVRPVPLGVEYRERFYQLEQIREEPVESTATTIQIWESYPMVSPGQEQEIGVAVLSGNSPLAGAQPVLELTLPDGDINTYTLPPTDQRGETYITVPPVNAPNGTLVPYKVCVDTAGGQKFCIMDSYLIWQADYIMVTPTLPPQNTSYLPFVIRNIKVYVPAVIEQMKFYLPVVMNGE